MRVPRVGKAETRFKRRWEDYCAALLGELGTVEALEPRPPNIRAEVEAALRAGGESPWAEADRVLQVAWRDDERRWPRRLSKFLDRLSATGRKAFAELVSSGCQPDCLAEQFALAAGGPGFDAQREEVLDEARTIEGLGEAAVAALKALANRQVGLEALLSKRRWRVFVERTAGAELSELLEDLLDAVDRNAGDINRLRRSLDGRRRHLTAHAEGRLARRVVEATGRPCGRLVREVLNDLRVAGGQDPLSAEAFKKRRKRQRARTA